MFIDQTSIGIYLAILIGFTDCVKIMKEKSLLIKVEPC